VLQEGTRFRAFGRIALPVLCAPSKLVRLIQAADVVVGCTCAYVAGEDRHSPPVFEGIRDLLVKDGRRVGGVGLKLHPDIKYANLYHWLLGDSHIWKGMVGHPLPLGEFPYSEDPLHP
jgi:hypothetical protein